MCDLAHLQKLDMSEADTLDWLNKRKCPDCRSERLSPGLRIDIAEHLTCLVCEARFYVAPRAPNAKAFIRQ